MRSGEVAWGPNRTGWQDLDDRAGQDPVRRGISSWGREGHQQQARTSSSLIEAPVYPPLRRRILTLVRPPKTRRGDSHIYDGQEMKTTETTQNNSRGKPPSILNEATTKRTGGQTNAQKRKHEHKRTRSRTPKRTTPKIGPTTQQHAEIQKQTGAEYSGNTTTH